MGPDNSVSWGSREMHSPTLHPRQDLTLHGVRGGVSR